MYSDFHQNEMCKSELVSDSIKPHKQWILTFVRMTHQIIIILLRHPYPN